MNSLKGIKIAHSCGNCREMTYMDAAKVWKLLKEARKK